MTVMSEAKVRSVCKAEPVDVAEYQIIQNSDPTRSDTSQLKKL